MKNLKKFTDAMHEAAGKDESWRSYSFDGLFEKLKTEMKELDGWGFRSSNPNHISDIPGFEQTALRLARIAAEIAGRVL